MKTKLVMNALTAGGLGLTLLLTACDDNSTRSDSRTLSEATKDAASEVREASAEAWNSFSSYTVEKKDDALAFLNRQTSELDEEIDELRADGGELSAEAKEELAELREELAEEIREAREATGEGWIEAKRETQEKWVELKNYVRELRQELDAS